MNPIKKIITLERISSIFSKGDLSSPETLSASKQIMREAIDFHLGNKPLKIREYLSLQGS
ncbi:MAG: hypothetical protein Ct9H300mP3_01750 [Gammaproteobacteria bacterium]|nr:MAG: hypothetical protein Ct9H300mP3_01750 [Gammaproteobacteria bacterium]